MQNSNNLKMYTFRKKELKNLNSALFEYWYFENVVVSDLNLRVLLHRILFHPF